MKVVEVIGLLLILGGVLLIDMPKLAAISEKRKYSLIYGSVLVLCFLLGTLEIFSVLPTFNGLLENLYATILGK